MIIYQDNTRKYEDIKGEIRGRRLKDRQMQWLKDKGEKAK
jgi:hypothetical protein